MAKISLLTPILKQGQADWAMETSHIGAGRRGSTPKPARCESLIPQTTQSAVSLLFCLFPHRWVTLTLTLCYFQILKAVEEPGSLGGRTWRSRPGASGLSAEMNRLFQPDLIGHHLGSIIHGWRWTNDETHQGWFRNSEWRPSTSGSARVTAARASPRHVKSPLPNDACKFNHVEGSSVLRVNMARVPSRRRPPW